MTYFCPALDPPLDGSGRKTTTLVRDLEYFIHTKFHQNPSSGSGEEVENVNSLMDGRRTDAGQPVITKGHWSLWLLCPKNNNTSSQMLLDHCYTFGLLLWPSNSEEVVLWRRVLIDPLWPCPGSTTVRIWPNSQYKCAGVMSTPKCL